jgi:hypothetical protein
MGDIHTGYRKIVKRNWSVEGKKQAKNQEIKKVGSESFNGRRYGGPNFPSTQAAVPAAAKDWQINNCRTSEGDSPIFVGRKSGQSPTYLFADPTHEPSSPEFLYITA